jgi:MerR family transcriptional regulator, redox-sensitive transcriptional activator SoxR
MREFTIGEVARRAGLQTSAIRYYESLGLLPAPKRVNGQRRYDSGIFQRLGLIKLIREAGFRISELQMLFTVFSADTPPSAHWRTLAATKVAELETAIEHAQTIKAWLTEVQKLKCTPMDDCAVVMFDEAGNVSLTCRN